MTGITDEKEGHHKLPRRLRVSRGITLLYPTRNTHPDVTYRWRNIDLPREDRKVGLEVHSSLVCKYEHRIG